MTDAHSAAAEGGHFDAAYYDANDQGGDRIALWYYARLAARLAPRGATAFEYGSGTGHLSRRLSKRFRSMAYDVSQYAREATATASPSTSIIASTADIPDGSVDLV